MPVTVERDCAFHVRELCRAFPVVTITGPRQSGKATLCRHLFPDKPYVSLESLDQRSYAANDPRAFLNDHRDGAVIDEVQRVPDLLSYLQVEVDERPEVGRFVLTGSANLALLESVSQSLAGRTGLVTLLPCTRRELEWLGAQNLGPSMVLLRPLLIYGGSERQARTRGEVIPWSVVQELDWAS